jgi:hypothetical protein
MTLRLISNQLRICCEPTIFRLLMYDPWEMEAEDAAEDLRS